MVFDSRDRKRRNFDLFANFYSGRVEEDYQKLIFVALRLLIVNIKWIVGVGTIDREGIKKLQSRNREKLRSPLMMTKIATISLIFMLED